MKLRRILTLLALPAAGLAMPAYGHITVAAATTHNVDLIDTPAFDPRNLTIDAGDTVQWTFTGALPHTVTSADGLFDTGVEQPGFVFSFTFDEPGAYVFYCKLHGTPDRQNMAGTIVVQGEPTATATHTVQSTATSTRTPTATRTPSPTRTATPAPSASATQPPAMTPAATPRNVAPPAGGATAPTPTRVSAVMRARRITLPDTGAGTGRRATGTHPPAAATAIIGSVAALAGTFVVAKRGRWR